MLPRTRPWKLTSVLMAGLLFVGGCAAAPATTPSPGAQTPTPPPATGTPTTAPATDAPTPAPTGGTLTVGMPGDINGTEPQVSLLSLDQTIYLPNVFDPLVFMNFEGVPEPRLLESWEQIEDLVWEFSLRRDVQFHNGEPWNAEAFAWNWTREFEDGQPRHANLELLSQFPVEVVDEFTVRLTLAQPAHDLFELLAVFFMVPPAYVQEEGDEGFRQHPIGTGPFRFVEWVPADHMTLEANPDYWGGAPNVDTVILKPIPEISTRVGALQVGEVDLILAVPPDQVDRIESDEITIHSAGIPGVVYIQMFPDSPKGGGEPLNDVRVRQALNYAVNVDAIIEHVLNGYGQRTATIVSSQAFGYDPTITPYPYDPEMARQLLAEAGYPNGFSIGFDLASLGLPNDLQVMEAVIADWAAVGVIAEVNNMDRAAIVPLKLEFQIAPLFFWTFRGFDADNPGYRQLRSGEVFFYYAGHTPEVDVLLDAQKASTDPEERRELWSQILRKFHEDAPYVVLYEPMAIYAARTRVVGFEPRAKDTVFLGDVSLAD